MPGPGCGPERIRMPEEKRGEPKDGAEAYRGGAPKGAP